MRDWLYKNNIFTAGLFLKDYRHFFSFLEGELLAKDLKIQGLYKLNQLLDILLMTGIPDELVLMGDNFESDPSIYLTLQQMLVENNDPWVTWNSIKEKDIFQLKKNQNSKFLNKIYQLDNILTRKRKSENFSSIQLKIYIRKRFKDDEVIISSDLNKFSHTIKLYDGLYREQFEKMLREKNSELKDKTSD